ncbi:MAG: L,D-transpeptidase/peptidoglycan binding protein [Butyrivibrio sp.]|jgi:lipoprotein-anchoring transpeptidase ErfK/SrfK|nr:L,D-transpeptidase/peptidoglycan binding protein [Butyrivibrio sp.]
MKKTLGLAGVVAIAVLAVIYIGFSLFFMNHFQFHTMLNDQNVSMKTEKEIEKQLSSEAENYQITITGRNDLKATISAKEISLQPVFDGKIEQLQKSANAFAWPVSLFVTRTYQNDSVADYSEDELSQKISGLAFWDASNVTAPADATYAYQNGSYQIVPEVEGTTLNREQTVKAITSAVGGMEEELSLEDAGCYQAPAVRKDDENLKKTVAGLNQFVGTTITFAFGDQTEVLNGDLIKDWLTVSGTDVKLNEDQVKAYVKTLAQKYDTFGSSRSFHTASGKDITVNGGDYGWWMDRDSTTKAIIQALTAQKSGAMTPVYYATAAVYGTPDYGNSYVEVDLDAQHVYVYKDGKQVVSTDCVSGKAVVGHGTPDGTYSITYKEKDATLVGENYSSPVKFWMPFNGNIGLHDASWRSSFGGTIYVNGGSHGCINLPSKKAGEIFAAVEKGEAVVVHGGMTQDQARAFDRKGKDDASAGADASAVSGTSASAATPVPAPDAITGSTAVTAPVAQATAGADTVQ